MPRYDEDVRFAAKTADRFERLQADQAAEAETCQDEEMRRALNFANWMIGRKIGSFRRFADCQLEGRHEVALIFNGSRVCTCGLITDVSGEDPDAGVEFANAEGHL
jgi:hypothetical protein